MWVVQDNNKACSWIKHFNPWSAVSTHWYKPRLEALLAGRDLLMSNIKVKFCKSNFWAVHRGSRRPDVIPLSKDMTDHKGYKQIDPSSRFSSPISWFWHSTDHYTYIYLFMFLNQDVGHVALWYVIDDSEVRHEEDTRIWAMHPQYPCCSTEMGLFALYLRIENSRQRRASSAAAAVTFFGTLRHTGLLWREGARIVHNEASACLRGVTDLNPGTEWPFSADSYAGLRLLNLHEQQTSTNMLLTMFNGRHKGEGRL